VSLICLNQFKPVLSSSSMRRFFSTGVWHVTSADAGLRIGRFLKRDILPSLSRSQIATELRRGTVKVNGLRVRQHVELKGGEAVEVDDHLHKRESERTSALESVTQQFDMKNKTISIGIGHSDPKDNNSAPHDVTVLYCDAHVLAVNKPSGLVTQGRDGSLERTCV
jgi:23S rRNA-/tRNA-specific pseudouridylate synthase